MPFELIEARTPTHAERRAAVTLTLRANAERPALRVTVYREFLDLLQWESGTGVRLHIGTGDDVGRIMISRGESNKIATFTVMRGMAYMDFGAVPALIARYGKHSRLRTPATLLEHDSQKFVLQLPSEAEWPLKTTQDDEENQEEDDEEDGESEDAEPPPVASAPAEPKTLPAFLGKKATEPEPEPDRAPASPPRKLADAAGILVRTNPSTLCYRQKTTPLNEVQAAFLAILVKASPGVVPFSEIANRGYLLIGRAPGNNSVTMVQYELRNAVQKLEAMGIKLTLTKGMGYSLRPAD